MRFVCPHSKAPLQLKSSTTLIDPETGVEFHQANGIWQMIPADRMGRYEQFIHEYETVRKAENRGSGDPAFYHKLPVTLASHPAAAMWRQRAHSYHIFLERILKPVERMAGKLTLIDMGAGNGWLSNRLAERGHTVAAVDLTVNAFDGLGVHTAYTHAFTPIQAEFDYLPLAENQFDGVIFNASFHYSADYAKTLTEAARLIKPHGFIAVVDSPVYSHHSSGQQMVAEREARFKARYGFKSDRLQSENYLTHSRIRSLENELNIFCKQVQTIPQFQQAVRKFKTFVRREREAAQFPILLFSTGNKGSSNSSRGAV